MKLDRPRQREVFRAAFAPGHEAFAVVVSCSEANAVRSVVVLCELCEDPSGRFKGLPTTVAVPAADSELGKDYVAVASPYTLPKNCLIERMGTVSPQLYERLEDALRRVFGWSSWPV